MQAVAVWAASAALVGSASAGIYTYTPPNSTTDLWSAGTDWSATPISDPTTELTFVGSNSTILAGGLTNTSTDDISGAFSLNILDLQGTGPDSGGAASITIAAQTGDSLNFITNGTTAPVINLNALSGASGLTYNVSAGLTLANTTTFQGSGTATFKFSGVISGAGGLTIATTGTTGPTLTAQNTFTGPVVVNSGTLYINGGNTSTGTLGNSSSITINNGGTISIVGGDNSLVGSGGFNGGRTITINAGGVLTSLANLSGHLGRVVLAGGTLASTGAVGGTVPTYGLYDLDHSVTAGGVTATSVISALDMALSESGGTVFTVNPGATSGIDLAVTGTFFHATAANLDRGLIKQGLGVMSLSGANTYTSSTTVNAGTLLLDFSAPGAPTSNIINNSTNNSSLFMGGATFQINGSASTANTQQMNGLTLNAGSNTISLNSNGNDLLLNLGAISRTSGVVDFILPSGGQTATNGILASGTLAGGILPFATVSGSNWATINGSGNVVAYTGYTDVPSGGLITSSAAANVRINGGFAGVPTGIGTGTTTINSLLQNNAGVAIIDTTGATLNIGSGGVLVPAGSGATYIGIAPGAGNLTAGSGAPGELILNNDSTNALTIYSTIADNGAGATSLSAQGTGTVVLAGPNTFTGSVTSTGGGLIVAHSLALQNTVLPAGNITFSSSVSSNAFTIGGLSGSSAFAIQNDASKAIAITFGGNNTTATYSGVLSGPGSLVKTGSGTQTLSAINTFSGGLTISSGKVISTTGGGTTALGTGPVTVDSGAILEGDHSDAFGYTAGSSPATIFLNGGTITSGSGAYRITLQNIEFQNGGRIGSLNGNTGDSSGNYSFNGGTVIVDSSPNTAIIDAPDVSLQAGTVTFKVARGTAASDLTISSVISSFGGGGGQNLLKSGNGIMTLTAANTYASGTATTLGGTYVTGGTLVTDFSAAGAPTSNIINSSSFLSLGSGTLLINGSRTTAVSQSFNTIGIAAGASSLQLASHGQDVLASLSFLASRALGGTVDFVPPSGASSATNGINTLFGASNNGIFGGFATVNGADWATTDSNTNIVALTTYSDVASNGTISDDGTANVRLNGGTVTLANTGSGSVTNAYTLLQKAGASATTVTLGGAALNLGGGTAAFGSPAGVLVAPAAGQLTLGATPDEGFLTAAGGGGELVFINNSSNSLILNATLSQGDATAVTTSGSGTTVLLGTNAYTGQTTVAGGTLQVGAGGTNGQLGTGSVVVFGNLAFNRSDAVTVADTITGAGTVTQNGAGSVTLSKANAFTGGLILNTGTLVSATSGGTTALGNGPVTVNANATLVGGAQDSFGYAPNPSPAVININGGTVTEAAGAFRVTLPNIEFVNGGTLTNPTGTGGNTGDANGNYSFFGGTITVDASANVATISATKIGVQNNTTFNVARGTAASDLLVSSALTSYSGTHSVTFNGTGITTLSANNTFGGGLILNGGTVISTSSGGATSLGAGPVTVNPGATLLGGAHDSFGYTSGQSPSVINLNGGTVSEAPGAFRITLPSLTFSNGGTLTNGGNTGESDGSGNFSFFGGTITVNPSPSTALVSATKVGLQAGTLTFNVGRGTSSSDLTISSNLISFGSTTVNKTGAGVMTLTGTNTYTATTNVNAGTLLTNGTGTAPLAVNSTGVLAGTGSNSSTLAVNAGGTVSAGNAYTVPGKLTVTGTTTLALGSGIVGDAANGATYLWKMNDAGVPNGSGTAGNSTGWDLLSLNTVAVSGTGTAVTVQPISVGGGYVNGPVANFSPTSSYSWPIITLTGGGGPALAAQLHLDTNALSTFATANNTSPSNFSITSDANDVFITFAPAPEPASFTLLGIAAGGLLLRRRRRAKASGPSIG